jgi:hypothetical protein
MPGQANHLPGLQGFDNSLGKGDFDFPQILQGRWSYFQE